MMLRRMSVAMPLVGAVPDADLVIEIFQGWIRSRFSSDDDFFAGEILVDVVDYRHVPRGPGVLLVGHEIIYALGEDGLRVTYRRDDAGPAADKIAEAANRLIAVAGLLESHPTLGVTFCQAELEVRCNDRSLALSAEALAEISDQALSRVWAVKASSTPSRRDPRGPVSVVSVVAEV